MGFFSIPPVSGSGSSGTQAGIEYAATAAQAETPYNTNVDFTPGTYSISCPASVVSTVSFWSGTTYIGQATTDNGAVLFNLGSNADSIIYWTDSGTDVVISFALSGVPLATGLNGTLDVLTTSQTYTANGFGYVFCVGGGYNGNSGSANQGGSGGASGRLSNTITVDLSNNTPISVTVGAVGGGNSSFGNLLTTVGGEFANGGGGGNGGGGNGGSTSSGVGLPLLPGSTGGGGGGVGLSGSPGAGGGDGGIGRGGGSNGGATGYGSGGGGGNRSGTNSFNNPGGAGRPGGVFVIRYDP